MTQCLGALAALAKELDLVPSTYVTAHKHLDIMYVHAIHTYIQETHTQNKTK